VLRALLQLGGGFLFPLARSACSSTLPVTAMCMAQEEEPVFLHRSDGDSPLEGLQQGRVGILRASGMWLSQP